MVRHGAFSAENGENRGRCTDATGLVLQLNNTAFRVIIKTSETEASSFSTERYFMAEKENRPCMVSVLCAAYNHSAYLAQTIESFAAQQTDFRFEIIVNDDCSTDNTAEILRECAAKYPDLVVPVYQEKNLFSQNIEIYEEVFYPRAQGKYIAFCEGDDYWSDPHKLQQQVDFLEANPEYTACVHNTTLHYCNGDRPDTPHLPVGQGDRDVDFAAAIKGMSNAWHTSALLARREYIVTSPDFLYTAVNYGFSDQPRGIWLLMNGKVRYLDREMSVYRLNSNQDAWSSGVDMAYDKHIRFVTGETEMLRQVLPHCNAEQRGIVQQSLLEREFELLYIQGKDAELVKPPYLSLYRQQSRAFRLKQWVKRNLPFVQRLHRQNKGYGN